MGWSIVVYTALGGNIAFAVADGSWHAVLGWVVATAYKVGSDLEDARRA